MEWSRMVDKSFLWMNTPKLKASTGFSVQNRTWEPPLRHTQMLTSSESLLVAGKFSSWLNILSASHWQTETISSSRKDLQINAACKNSWNNSRSILPVSLTRRRSSWTMRWDRSKLSKLSRMTAKNVLTRNKKMRSDSRQTVAMLSLTTKREWTYFFCLVVDPLQV